ncbi:MAG: hypothetical protein K0S61_1104 [Anaerocolumna sp.]|jgi:cytoskeletal protein CcmA (bactofilin family)|nr:hypothetical protein [Anaerocolumna sp.]
MGFFKDFKEDLSQAVNELLPDEVLDDTPVVNTLEDDVKEAKEDEGQVISDVAVDDNADEEMLNALLAEEESKEMEEILPEEKKSMPEDGLLKSSFTNQEFSEPVDFDETEVTIITKTTVIGGNMHSEGSLEVMGTINGDVSCQGKLSVIGSVTGNCTAGEVYVGSKRLVGSITCRTSVKIGLGTVILGNIIASEGTIAGAVKGDIDINGPVVIDSSAIIKGNIKAQSIQINNGAIIEGFCSLSYASIDIDNIFE